MIELNQLCYRYGTHDDMALDGISASIDSGIHLLLGENGAGKTTLLKIIAGMLLPSAGTCRLDGADISLRRPSSLSRCFYLGSETFFPLRDMATVAKLHGCFFPRFSPESMIEKLQRFGISPSQRLSKMSLGTRQKAMLAYALSLNVDVLLLDEPTNGLDIESKAILQDMLLSSANDDSIVIVSTHIISDLQNIFDRMMVMQKNRLLLNADTNDIAERLAFVSSYSEIPGALFSEWSAGALHSIISPLAAEDLDLRPGPVDLRLLYIALHSKTNQDVVNALQVNPLLEFSRLETTQTPS